MLPWLLASFHLLAFGIGLGAIWVRARSLSSAQDLVSIRRALRADAWWGIAALLWLGTGLPRLLMGTEKATGYYLSNHVFWLKMAMFVVIFFLELGPIVTLGAWRGALRRGQAPDTRRAARFATTSRIQLVLLLLILFAATAMARGYGLSLASSPLLAQSTTPALHWGPAPAAFPKGALMAVVSGDPSEPAMFTIELAMPAGYRIPPHFHPTDEHVTIKEGIFLVGMGDRLDEKQARTVSLLASLEAAPRRLCWRQEVCTLSPAPRRAALRAVRPTIHPAQGAP